MFKTALFLTLVGFCVCTPLTTFSSTPNEPVPILSQDSHVDHDGSFKFSFESGDGTKVHEEGQLKVIDKDQTAEVVQGSYEFKTPEGQQVVLSYIADENGFQPNSDILPQAPPIPEAIARSLKYIEEHPQPEEHHKQ